MGMRMAMGVLCVWGGLSLGTHGWASEQPQSYFTRTASFEVWRNLSQDQEAVAEIVAATADGQGLVYTDSENEGLGLVDISDPSSPKAAGFVDLGGEPTSVVVKGGYALVCINNSLDYISVSGQLVVVDIASKTVVRRLELGGQPDSIALSPSQQYAAIAIENERDEDLGNGFPPQEPSGFVQVAKLDGSPSRWTLRKVALDSLSMAFSGDPEPEYIDINESDLAVVTLQENNHLVLIDLPTATIKDHFSAGHVDLAAVDTVEDGLITSDQSLSGIPREPDGVSWISATHFATANEGDLQGGSRGFSIFNTAGQVVFDSQSQMEHESIRLGHYPEGRSENKGNEPENVEFAQFDGESYLFVGSERANLVMVYKLDSSGQVSYIQSLPTGVGPEGILALPSRQLLVAAAEKDDREKAYRSTITIYSHGAPQPSYPQIVSASAEGLPLPWGALSGLVHKAGIGYGVGDSAFRKSQIFTIDTRQTPALITGSVPVMDQGALSMVAGSLVNDDGTVDLDLEGITTSAQGGFWLVSEGSGSPSEASEGRYTPNLLLRTDTAGLIQEVVSLPFAMSQRQVKFGFEGVASVVRGGSEYVFVAFQRPLQGQASHLAFIGRYHVASQQWHFFDYPLEQAEGLWTGLSEIAVDDEFMYVLERDKLSGHEARVKSIFKVRLESLLPGSLGPRSQLLDKSLHADLIPKYSGLGRLCPEKLEAMSVVEEQLMIINDNDGVDENSGETTLIRVGR